MKTYIYTIISVVGVMMICSSCSSSVTGSSDEISPGYSFIAMHWDEDSDERPYFSMMNISNGEIDLTHLTDVYPSASLASPSNFTSWKQSFHQANGLLGFTLHRDLSETVTNDYGEEFIRWTGAWMDIGDGEVHELPKLSPCTDFGYSATDCNRYSYTRRNSVRTGKSGHVFYIAESAHHSATWHHEPRYRIIRLDPQTGEYEVSPLISDWTLSQPEIDADRYGLASITELFPSACGRYVYGRTAGWGIDFGNLIASHALLFRYDFDTEEYSRVEEVPYNISLTGITADDRYILYSNRNDRNNYRYDTQTGESILIEEAGIGYSYQTMMHNNGGIGGAYPLRQLWHGNIIEDTIYQIPVPNHPDRPIFSADGTRAYFRYRNCENNYLLRLNDLTEEATVDTVAALPPGLRVMTVY